MGNPMNELWQAQQDAATRMAEGWRTLLQPATDRTASPPAPAPAADPPPQPVATGTHDAGTEDVTAGYTIEEITEPEPEPEPSALGAIQAIQALSEGQRDFAGQMARWAELQHEFADTLTTWARRQQDHADALDHALAPFALGTVDRPA
jgi:hypothetical protein